MTAIPPASSWVDKPPRTTPTPFVVAVAMGEHHHHDGGRPSWDRTDAGKRQSSKTELFGPTKKNVATSYARRYWRVPGTAVGAVWPAASCCNPEPKSTLVVATLVVTGRSCGVPR